MPEAPGDETPKDKTEDRRAEALPGERVGSVSDEIEGNSSLHWL